MFSKPIYLAVALPCLVAATATHASILVPDGLKPGDMYHLAFVTRFTIDATSSLIVDYNQFVQDQAALNPSLTGTDMGVTWKAIASTAMVDARDNALVEAPVYLLDATTKIADGFSDMWDGTLDAPLDLDQFVMGMVAPAVWTGSNPSGTSNVPHFLGGIDVVAGRFSSDSQWMDASREPNTTPLPLYALSAKLTVAVPEPTSVVNWLCLVSVVPLCGSFRRRYFQNRWKSARDR
jgi:hypothetical protein